MSAKISDFIKKYLANNYALYLKTQNYHWNIVGNNFAQLHKLLEDQYENHAEFIDELAEHIRSLDTKVPASFAYFMDCCQLNDPDENASCIEMLRNLKLDHEKLIQMTNEGIEQAKSFEDEATTDLFIDRLRQLEKNRWMLKASLAE